jgi:hypothetical protein
VETPTPTQRSRPASIAATVRPCIILQKSMGAHACIALVLGRMIMANALCVVGLEKPKVKYIMFCCDMVVP